MTALRIVFMGTPELARVNLAALLASSETKVVAVVTQPDRPKGRELKLQPSPVKELALEQGVPVLQPARARDATFVQEMRLFEPELIVVAAFGQILPESILTLPRLGCVNVHTSLLPKYRGAAPIQWAIANGESETGVTIMQMDAGLDTGAILTQEKTSIGEDETSETLHDRLAKTGAVLLLRTMPDLAAGRVTPVPQPAEGVSHAPRIKKEDGRIDWRLPARTIRNRMRAFTPWPGTFTALSAEAGRRVLKIWRADLSDHRGQPGEVLRADKTGILVATGSGSLNITELQLEGGRRLSAGEFLAGHPAKAGALLS